MAHPFLRPRWLIGTVLVTAIVVGCISAGFWQLRRLDERRDENTLIRQRAGEPVPLPASGFDAGDGVEKDLAFRRVEVTGTYDPANELLVRFRSRKGLPGYEVVTPLQTGVGAVLVNRGWVPLEVGDRWPVASASPPVGEVTVVGMLAPPEQGALRLEKPKSAGAPAVVGAVDPRALRAALPYADLYELPVLASGNDAGSGYPVPVDPPDLGEGPHRDYAVQWFLFAAVGSIGWIILVKRRAL